MIMILCMLLSFFLFSNQTIFSMIILFICLLYLVVYISFKLKLMFLSMLFGISFVSGLMVMFAYISSITPKVPQRSLNLIEPVIFSVFLFLMKDVFYFEMNWPYLMTDAKLTNSSFLMEGMFLFFLLLLSISFFLRFVYSKGGGLRMKFY